MAPLMYLTGVSTDESRAADRPSLGLLAQPGNSYCAEVAAHYDLFGADNGFYGLGRKADPTPEKVQAALLRWLRWIEESVAPLADRCLFVTVPDVLNWIDTVNPRTGEPERVPVGDAEATLERYPFFAAKVRSLGLPAALVAQDGLRSEGGFLTAGAQRLSWAQVDCLFVGGSDEFKLGPDAAALCREARRRGLWVHVGRVNSWKRIAIVRDHADSVDGTLLRFRDRTGPVNWPRLCSWLDVLEGGGEQPASTRRVGARTEGAGEMTGTKKATRSRAAAKKATAPKLERNKVDRIKAATEEAKAAKAAGWKWNKDEAKWERVSGRKARPATPNLDAINAGDGGETTSAKAPKAPRFQVGEAPKEAGTIVVALLGEAQVREVKEALKGRKVGARTLTSHVHSSNNLIVVRSEASAVATALAERAHATKGTAQREAWAAYLLVRFAAKAAHDESRGANPKRVNGLLALAKDGSVSEWSFVVDSSRQVTWTVRGKALNLKDAKGRELDAALAKLEEKAAKAAA